jgi:hypothetical protein
VRRVAGAGCEPESTGGDGDAVFGAPDLSLPEPETNVLRHKGRIAARSAASREIAAAAVVLSALSVPYFITLLSPLRLSGDSILYLSMARALATGEPYSGVGGYPTGYPWMVALLDRAGLGIPWAFVAMNLFFLAVGLLASYILLRCSFGFTRAGAVLGCAGVLLVHDVIGVAARPLSDAPFFGVAMLCLLLLDRSRQLRGLKLAIVLTAAALLAVAAVEIRTLGIALWPTLLFAAVSHPEIRPRLLYALRRRPFVTTFITSVFVAAVGAAAFIGISRTWYPRLLANDASWIGAGEHMKRELTALGELAVNLSTTSPHVPAAFDPFFVVAGVALLPVIAAGVWRRRTLGVSEVFALAVSIALIVWLEPASRLWMPVLPVLIGYGVAGTRALAHRPIARAGVALYILLFSAVGIATLGNSMRLSLSGSAFPEQWARDDPPLYAAYKVAFGQASAAAVGPPHPIALRILRWYEPRAHLHATRSRR